MKQQEQERGFFGGVKDRWKRLCRWASRVKIWQWALAIAALELAACIWVLPPLGRWLWGIEGGFWDGLERFGGITGLITLGISFLGFVNTKHILDYRTSDYQVPEEEQSSGAFDLFVRVKARSTDAAYMDGFVDHCLECCRQEDRSAPVLTRDGQKLHLARLLEDNNEQGFQSRFHQELFSTFGGDAGRVKACFSDLLEPVVIHYGLSAIQGQGNPVVYFDKPGPEGQDRVAGERMVEVYFPMDLPRNDHRKRQAFLAYFTAVMQQLFKYFHNVRLCYYGPAMLMCTVGSIADNNHILETYQFDGRGGYYLAGRGDQDSLIDSFLNSIR